MSTPPQALLVLVLLLAACGGEGDADGAADVAVPARTLVMSDNAFEPQTWQIAEEGAYTLENEGHGLHNLMIEEADVDADVAPGECRRSRSSSFRGSTRWSASTTSPRG